MTTFTNPHERIEQLMLRVELLEAAVNKAADTFDDLEHTALMLGRTILAQSCRIAGAATRHVLTASETEGK